MKSRILVVAALTGLVTLTGTGPAAAEDTGESTIKVTVLGGELLISVSSATSNMGSVENTPRGTRVSGSIGEVTVRDNRNAPPGSSWVVTASATQLATPRGPGIPADNIRYRPGRLTTQGDVTATAADQVILNRARAVVTAREITGSNVVSWTPTVTVTIPPDVLAGTYTGTITHSVL